MDLLNKYRDSIIDDPNVSSQYVSGVPSPMMNYQSKYTGGDEETD